MRTLGTAVAVLLFCATAARLTAQEPVKPGPEHERLKKMAGVWDATIQNSAGESKGTLHSKIGLDGLWLLDHFKGQFGPISFEGMGATTYDVTKKKYVSVWIDSMSTSPINSEGVYDMSKNALIMNGQITGPEGKAMKVVMTTQLQGEDAMVFTMRAPGPDGKDFEMMKITYKRQSK